MISVNLKIGKLSSTFPIKNFQELFWNKCNQSQVILKKKAFAEGIYHKKTKRGQNRVKWLNKLHLITKPNESLKV